MVALSANLFNNLEKIMDANMEIIPIISTSVLYHVTGKESGQVTG
jgi:hypothetical protein